MTIRELLSLESKGSNVEEFFALLYGQNIHPAFKVFNNLSINFISLEGMSVFCFSIDTILKRKTNRQTAPYADEDTTAKD